MDLPIRKTIKNTLSNAKKLLTRRTVGSEALFKQQLRERTENESALDVIKRIKR